MLATPKFSGEAEFGVYPTQDWLVARWRLWLSLVFVFVGICSGPAAENEAREALRRSTQKDYTDSLQEFREHPDELKAALRLGEASFLWAEQDVENRAMIAEVGIDAARAGLRIDASSGPAHYYLAMNLGQLARTKTFGALKLVRQMEKEFLSAVKQSPKIHHGGAHRSLGMLYEQAPGWPLSVGNRKKARKHLEQAVELVPEYVENHLALMDAYLRWKKADLVRKRLKAAREALEVSREKVTGVKGKVLLEEWERRLTDIEKRVK